MRVTLRKADNFQRQLGEAVKALSMNTTVSLTEYDDATAVFANAREKNEKTLATLSLYRAAYYQIRRDVAVANVESGISGLLADQAMIEAEIGSMAALVKAEPSKPSEQIRGLQGKMQSGEAKEIYGGTITQFTSGIYSEEEITHFGEERAALRRKLADIKDDLLAKNTGTFIELDDVTQLALKKAGII